MTARVLIGFAAAIARAELAELQRAREVADRDAAVTYFLRTS